MVIVSARKSRRLTKQSYRVVERTIAIAITIAVLGIATAWMTSPGVSSVPHPGILKSDPKVNVDALVVEGRKQLMLDPAAALTMAERAQRIARAHVPSAERDLLEAKAGWLKGAALFGNNRAPEAVAVLEDALQKSKGLSDQPVLLGDLNMALANARSVQGRTEAALYGLQRAYNYYHIAKQGRSEALALQNIGTIYLFAHDYDQALHYYDQAAAAYHGDVVVESNLLFNRGNVFKEQGKIKDAIAAFARVADMAHGAHIPVMEVMAISNLAGAQLLANDTRAADRSIQRGFKAGAALDIAKNYPGLLEVAADVARRRGRLDEARRLIEQALAGAVGSKSQVFQRQFERTAYEIYKQLDDQPRALGHLERYKQLDDQARALAASASAAVASARFEFAKQDADIAQLRQQRAEQEATIQRRLLAAAALILIMLLIGFLSIRRSRNQVRAANDELTGTNAELERALAARTEFLATTSHEIRTPLNGILGMTQVLLANRALDADIKGKIELVQGAGETMKALVDDILDVAKIANGELTIHPAEMDLLKLLREAGQVWEAQAHTKQVAIELDLADAPDRIVEDEVRLRQIVFNLMANAVKFTDRGAVRLKASITPAVDAGSGTLRIAISDTGIGIPPDRLEDIFESFRQIDGGTTRRHGGTGLGLAICRNLARAMGGDVQVTSILGAGSTFAVELPCAPVARPAARSAPVSLAETRLLLAEANPLARSIQTAVLTPHVDRIVPAGDLSEARAAVSTDEIDIALADAGLFGGDIAQAEQFARVAADHGVPLVLLWPSPDENVRERAKAAGILRIIAKPIPAQEMVAALKDIYMTDGSRQEIAA